MNGPLRNDRELAEATAILDEMIDDRADMDDPLFVALSDLIEEYEARTDVLNRPPDGTEPPMAVRSPLTVAAAADFLAVSPGWVEARIAAGEIPPTLRLSELFAFKKRLDAGRDAALTELVRQAQVDGAYDLPGEGG